MVTETSNLVPLINGVEYAWGDITLTLGGEPVVGITAIDYGEEQVIENHYGAGRYPVSRSKGKITPSAKITASLNEVIRWQNQSPTGRLQDLDPFTIVVSYIPEEGEVVNDKILNCQFTKNTRSCKEGDTQQLVELELLPSHIVWHKGKK